MGQGKNGTEFEKVDILWITVDSCITYVRMYVLVLHFIQQLYRGWSQCESPDQMTGVEERSEPLFGLILVAWQCTMPCTGGRCHLCLFGTLYNRPQQVTDHYSRFMQSCNKL